jgi:hypothetical protein
MDCKRSKCVTVLAISHLHSGMTISEKSQRKPCRGGGLPHGQGRGEDRLVAVKHCLGEPAILSACLAALFGFRYVDHRSGASSDRRCVHHSGRTSGSPTTEKRIWFGVIGRFKAAPLRPKHKDVQIGRRTLLSLFGESGAFQMREEAPPYRRVQALDGPAGWNPTCDQSENLLGMGRRSSTKS